MEDIIFFAVVVLSIVFSIVKNYMKETKKDEKRVIVKQPTPVSTPQPLVRAKRTLVAPATQSVENPSKPKDLPERLDRVEVSQYESIDYSSKSEKMPRVSTQHEENEAFSLTEHNYNEINGEKTFGSKVAATGSSFNNVFEDKDDLKKAIIYSTLLERKF